MNGTNKDGEGVGEGDKEFDSEFELLGKKLGELGERGDKEEARAGERQIGDELAEEEEDELSAGGDEATKGRRS